MNPPRGRRLPPVYWGYAGLTALAAPLIRAHVRRRMAAAGVARERISERFGVAGMARPEGRLVWFHAVSVGELLSILGLIDTLRRDAPGLRVLVTTTTATSAEMAARRLPGDVVHQFAPIDTPGAVRRFLAHWHPDLAVFVESELWPRQIVAAHRLGIPLVLLQARLSQRSQRRWQRFGRVARALLSRFSLVLAQVEATRSAVVALGLEPARARTSGDLKASSDPLPVEPGELARMRKAIGDRPVWVAASSHPGEEELIAEAHGRFKEAHLDGLLILVPRHPERGDALAAMLRKDGWDVAQRAHQQEVGAITEIYLADTLGEMGLWYAIAPLAFVGGSFVPVGGHNPYEPAHADCAILHGPLVANFAATYGDMDGRGAARCVADAGALGAALVELNGSALAEDMAKAARRFASEGQGIREAVAQDLLALLK